MSSSGATAGADAVASGDAGTLRPTRVVAQGHRLLSGRVPWLAAFGAVLAACLWARTLGTAWLVVGAAALTAALFAGRASGSVGASTAPEHSLIRLWWPLALTGIALALAAGMVTDRRLSDLSAEWDSLLAAREATLTRELQRQMEWVVDRGSRAAAAASALSLEEDEETRFARLAAVRARFGVSALAIFDGNGEPIAWAGQHRGPIPAILHAGGAAIHYVERPLFSYLYFSSPVAESPEWRAVAAVLLQTEPILQIRGQASVAELFEQVTGARPHFTGGDGPGAAWRLAHDGVPVVYGQFEPVSQAAWRESVALVGQRLVIAGCMAALVLLWLGWFRGARSRRQRAAFVPLCAAAVVLIVAPTGPVLGLGRLYSPALFMLPIPGEVTLGVLLAGAVPVAALVAARRSPVLSGTRVWPAIAAGAAFVAIGFAGGLHLLLTAAAPPLLTEANYLWGGLFPAAILVLTTIAVLAVPRDRGHAGHGVRVAPFVIGIAVSAGLALLSIVSWETPLSAPVWLPAAWAVPFALMALGIAGYRGRGAQLARWMMAGWLAASAAVPHLWLTSMASRIDAAERELATLGSRADPYLDYLLRHFATDVAQRAARGESGVELLYRSWIASNMAREGYPVTIAIWSPEGDLVQELSLGGGALFERQTAPRWSLLQQAMDRARETAQPIVEVAENVPGVNQFLIAPLDDGRLVSLVVPPRVSLDWATVLAPFLGAPQRTDAELALVPQGVDADVIADSVIWRRSEAGWRSEALVRLPDGEYHAHLELRLPSVAVQLARGVLLISAALGGLFFLWFAGRVARGEPPAPFGSWRRTLRGFRARVTLSLFTFFLIPTVLFGWIAYRAFAGEITRAARATAERAVAQAVAMYPDEEQSLAVVANRIGAEVLQYHRGELILASSPEAVALGLYDAWMPATVYSALRSGEQLSVVETREIINHPYLLAYRRLAATGILAVPVSLRSGEAAIRQNELMHLVLFAILLGGILSLALSVAVGRALTEPIGQLQRAAAAVGAGRLNVRLPERRSDEFGDLFASFNRMIQRLRRARAQEIRSARVLAWGEMARQIAHEIKNPLTPIKLSVQHLKRAYRDQRPDFGDVLESNVDHVLMEIDRLSAVARAFSRYGAPSSSEDPLEPTPVDDIVREVVGLYRAGESDIRFEYDVGPDLPPALARPGELKEVLFNIVENARDAVDAGGSISVTANAADDHIEVVVSDDGHGIEPGMLDRIFEPHFSTRSTGTGLGLAIVRRLVEGWGGRIEVQSLPGDGTTIRIRMKRADRP